MIYKILTLLVLFIISTQSPNKLAQAEPSEARFQQEKENQAENTSTASNTNSLTSLISNQENNKPAGESESEEQGSTTQPEKVEAYNIESEKVIGELPIKALEHSPILISVAPSPFENPTPTPTLKPKKPEFTPTPLISIVPSPAPQPEPIHPPICPMIACIDLLCPDNSESFVDLKSCGCSCRRLTVEI